MSKKPQSTMPPCQRDNCTGTAIMYTRVSPQEYTKRIWLCLFHAKVHNSSWNYFADMSEKEIEAEYRNASLGINSIPHQKVQPKKQYYPRSRMEFFQNADDILHIFGEKYTKHIAPTHTPEEKKAIKTLNLTVPFTETDLKKAYRQLVKMHHPDKKGKESTNTMINITHAYKVLEKSL